MKKQKFRGIYKEIYSQGLKLIITIIILTSITQYLIPKQYLKAWGLFLIILAVTYIIVVENNTKLKKKIKGGKADGTINMDK